MNRLLAIGFLPAGVWILEGEQIKLTIDRFADQRNVLYAFLEDGEVKYVGKSVRKFRERMNGYRKPGSSQTTNVHLNRLIKGSLIAGHEITVLVLPDNGLIHYGPFHLNLAAGLEDSIISMIKPPWNGGKKTKGEGSEIEPMPVLGRFQFLLKPTYFDRGFFNVPASSEAVIGQDGQIMEVYCGESETPIRALINRRSNKNMSPRILGGGDLKRWFQEIELNSEIQVEVYSPLSIRLTH